MLVPSKSVPLLDDTIFETCQAKARRALTRELDLAGVKHLCEFLDFPQADESLLEVHDPLRFATVRVMGYLRLHQGGAEQRQLCRFSAAARDLQALLEAESHRNARRQQ